MKIKYRLNKLYTLYIAIFISTFIFVLNVYAEQKIEQLFELKSQRNMEITVLYDTERPIISFISPDGEELNPDNNPSILVEDFDKYIVYRIRNMMSGLWQISYDKLGNKEIDVRYAPWIDPISISEFSFNTDGNKLDALFKVDYIENVSYEYILSVAVLDEYGSISGKRQLSNGIAMTNEQIKHSVDLTDLVSYSKYNLLLNVYLEENGVELSDECISDNTFSYSGGNSLEAIKDFNVEINLTKQLVNIDWTEFAPYQVDEYALAVFNSDNLTEPIFFSSFASEIMNTSLLYDLTSDSIHIELSYTKSGRRSDICSKDISLNTGLNLNIETDEYSNSAQATIRYEVGKDTDIEISVNEEIQNFELSGKGSFSVNIAEYENLIRISYKPYENVTFILEANIYSDRTPPVLFLYENSNILTTNENNFTLVGETEPNCQIYIDGKQIDVRENGTFIYKLDLKNGYNSFDITAIDPANNISKQEIIINRSDEVSFEKDKNNSIKSFIPLICTLLVSVVIIIFVFFSSHIYKKSIALGRIFSGLVVIRDIGAVLGILSIISLAVVLYFRHYLISIVDSPDYFELVQTSQQDAYQAVVKLEYCNKLFISLCFICVVILSIVIISNFILKYIKKRKFTKNIDLDKILKKPKIIETVTDSSLDIYECPNCHAKYIKPVKFCSKCGHKIE